MKCGMECTAPGWGWFLSSDEMVQMGHLIKEQWRKRKTQEQEDQSWFCDLSNVTKSSQVGQVAKWAFSTSDKTSMSFLKIIENFCLQDPQNKNARSFVFKNLVICWKNTCYIALGKYIFPNFISKIISRSRLTKIRHLKNHSYLISSYAHQGQCFLGTNFVCLLPKKIWGIFGFFYQCKFD